MIPWSVKLQLPDGAKGLCSNFINKLVCVSQISQDVLHRVKLNVGALLSPFLGSN